MSSLPATVGARAVAPPMLTMAEIKARAALFVASKLAPENMTADQAAIIALKGHELGLGMMQSLEEIYVVKGRASMSAKLMISLYTDSGHGYNIIERNEKKVTILFERKNGQRYEHTLTMEEAVKAGWTGNPAWAKMPVVMLTYRAFASGIRIFAPEVLHRMVLREEAEQMAIEEDVIDGTATEVEGPADWANAAARDDLLRTQADCKLDDHDAILALSKAAGKSLARRGEWTGTLTSAKLALRAYADERDGKAPTQAEQKELF